MWDWSHRVVRRLNNNISINININNNDNSWQCWELRVLLLTPFCLPLRIGQPLRDLQRLPKGYSWLPRPASRGTGRRTGHRTADSMLGKCQAGLDQSPSTLNQVEQWR
mmetsp:Transcript_88483/g.159529  ORF Transcript_88483/g.159529 Transcript_88483/m.159529 type:complete len:108 (+) Transcript_88483:454-777(+)